MDLPAFQHAHEQEERIFSVRVNSAKLAHVQHLQTPAKPIPWCPQGWYLSAKPSYTFDPLFHAGAYYVQEASSMFIHHILTQLALPKNSTAVDMCAAPGGKTTLLANYFSEGAVISNEVIKTRNSILVENCTKWGTPNMVATQNDPKHFAALPGLAQVLVVDAPCSGSGLFRKDANAVAEWSENNVALCSGRQQRILADCLPCLQTDGYLIYATCSYSFQENEDIVNWLCSTQNCTSVNIPFPEEWGIVRTQINQAIGYRFYPNQVGGEGFFVAVLQYHGGTLFSGGKATTLANVSATEMHNINASILTTHQTVLKFNEQFLACNTAVASIHAVLVGTLYVKKLGISLGSCKHQQFLPEHDAAVSTLTIQMPSVELSTEQAIGYLQKLNPDLPPCDNGWVRVLYQNIGLGWIKKMNNRYNNYYPVNWRILKQ